MAVKADTFGYQGTWFPSGYYGHFRSKPRIDFHGEYRQLAKPQPPWKFIKRAKVNNADHVFSKHDNKQSFLTDASYFEQGLGRKRSDADTFKAKKDLMVWMPHKKELENGGPSHSMYQTTYRVSQNRKINQPLVHRPKSSFIHGKTTTSYRYTHGLDNPHRETINAMANEALSITYSNRSLRPKSTYDPGRESVASCLSWYEPKTPKPPAEPRLHNNRFRSESSTRPVVPAATTVVDAQQPFVSDTSMMMDSKTTIASSVPNTETFAQSLPVAPAPEPVIPNYTIPMTELMSSHSGILE